MILPKLAIRLNALMALKPVSNSRKSQNGYTGQNQRYGGDVDHPSQRDSDSKHAFHNVYQISGCSLAICSLQNAHQQLARKSDNAQSDSRASQYGTERVAGSVRQNHCTGSGNSACAQYMTYVLSRHIASVKLY
jgi:hypothetical protein